MVLRIATAVGKRLQGRILGKKHFARLCAEVATAAPGETILLDFYGVEAITGSWLNSALVPFYDWSKSTPNELYPLLCRLRKDWLDELRLISELSSTCFLIADRPEESPQCARLIGLLEPNMRETLDAVSERGEATGAELKGAKPNEHIGATAWNNRLKELYQRRLLRRERHGRQQRYYPVVPEVIYDGR